MRYQEKTRRPVPGGGGASAVQPVSEAAPPNSSYADLSDSPSGGLEQQMQALADMHCPAADDFVRTMLPCYEQNLDELTRMAL